MQQCDKWPPEYIAFSLYGMAMEFHLSGGIAVSIARSA